MRVLVTGAAGFIGQHVSAELVRRGCDVVALDGDPERARHHGVPLRSDCAAPAVLDRVRAAEFDAVVHLASIVDTRCTDDDAMRSTNTAKAIELADAARDSAAAFVYASSASVYGTIEAGHHVRELEVASRVSSGPLNAYARSKLALDEAMVDGYRGEHWPWIGMRFTNVFGTGEEHKGSMASFLWQTVRRTADGEPIRLFADTLHAARDWIPAELVAARIGAFLERPTTVGLCNMGSGVTVEFGTLVDWCEDFAGSRPELDMVPNTCAGAYQYWTGVDMTRWRTLVPSEPAPTIDDLRGSAARLFGAAKEPDTRG